MTARLSTTLSFLLLAAVATPAQSQEPPGAGPLRVFLDCNRCDFDYLRGEIRFVDYVREPADAQLHVLVTSQETGAGGDRFTFFFIGQRQFDGRADTLIVTTRQDATDDEERDALTRTLALGLVPFAARTELAGGLIVGYEGEPSGERTTEPVSDPWNLWVFRTRLGTTLSGEETEREISLDGSLSASRTTEAHKVDFSVSGDYSQEEIKADDADEEDITIVRRDYEAEAISVWSLGAHWSAGLYAEASSSSRLNQDLAVVFAPAIEYNLYPYDESTRRQILFTYRVGPAWYDYEELTLFGVTEETLVQQSLDISAAFRQPWGEVFGSLEGSNYFHDFALHRLDLFTGIDVRLFRGFSLEVDANVARIKDQIYIRAGRLTPEEILLGLRERGTDYEYELELGFSYSFGSVFNNVVNPRLQLGGGGRNFR